MYYSDWVGKAWPRYLAEYWDQWPASVNTVTKLFDPCMADMFIRSWMPL